MVRVQRIIVFDRKKSSKAQGSHVEVMKLYLDMPAKEVKPFFEAKVGKDVVKLALERFKLEYEDKGSYIFVSGEGADEDMRRLVVFCGVRQTVDGHLGKYLLGIVSSLTVVELIFWYSRFTSAYARGGYKDVYRVAKAFKILYMVE